MKKRAFTLVECVVASLVILIVLGTLAMAVKFFVEGSRQIEQRRSVLIVVSSEMSQWENRGYPETGETSRIELVGPYEYTIETSVNEISDGIRELTVAVTGSSGERAERIELVRKFYR